MASVIRARYAGDGFNRWGKWKRGPTWEVRMMARAHVEGWLINDPAKQAQLAEDLYQIGHDPAAKHPDRIAAIKALMTADFQAAKLDVDKKNAETARAALFAPAVVAKMLADPDAMAKACELDALLANADGSDSSGLREPGQRVEMALPSPPVTTEPQALRRDSGPDTPPTADHAPEAR